MDDLKQLLITIQNETRPIEGHTDPNAIQDCWNEAFDLVEYLQSELNDLVNNMTYEGNIAFIYHKYKLYSRQLGVAAAIIRKHGLMEEFQQVLKKENHNE